ncbi:MAG: hypothetical protein AAFP13_11390 [Pseudomonadota bacterium]
MTTRLALILLAIILCALAADRVLNGSEASVFLLRKFLDLIEWTAFWR